MTIAKNVFVILLPVITVGLFGFSIYVHELGHYMAAHICKNRFDADVSFELKFDRFYVPSCVEIGGMLSDYERIFILSAGPISNFLVSLFLVPIFPLFSATIYTAAPLFILFLINFVFFVDNILPVVPDDLKSGRDGGKLVVILNYVYPRIKSKTFGCFLRTYFWFSRCISKNSLAKMSHNYRKNKWSLEKLDSNQTVRQ